MSIESAAIQILQEHTTIWTEVGSRITPLSRDDKGKLPAIVYSSSEPNRQRLLDGSLDSIRRCSMSFECWANNYKHAKQIASHAVAALQSYKGTMQGYHIMLINAESSTEDKDFETPTNVVEVTATIIYTE